MKLTSPLSKATGFIFVVTALLLFTSSTSLAQTQEPAKPTSEVEQLKQRLQQLEQTRLNEADHNWSKRLTISASSFRSNTTSRRHSPIDL